MACVELPHIHKEGQLVPGSKADQTLNPLHSHKSAGKSPGSEGQYDSAPRTAPCRGGQLNPRRLGKEVRVCCDEELETSFTYVDENVNLQPIWKGHAGSPPQDSPSHGHPEAFPELSLMSDDDLNSESTGRVDYGFISAVTFLVSGISLVIISYAVPREVKADPDVVSAREMERLEKESARIGAHLDRCVIAGLCLLTLGGVVLSTLLMISLWKGELYRRKAFAYKRSAKLYGSISLKMRPGGTPSTSVTTVAEENIDSMK